MRHLGSVLMLGVVLAVILVLVSWGRPPRPEGISAKSPFNRTLNQLDLIEDHAAH